MERAEERAGDSKDQGHPWTVPALTLRLAYPAGSGLHNH